MTVPRPAVQQSPTPSHSFFFPPRSSSLPSFSGAISPPLTSFALYAPLPLFHPFPLPPPSRASSSLALSSPEGMSKCMVEWRREVGLALPNSISEKLGLREAWLPSESENAGLLSYSFISGAGERTARRDKHESQKPINTPKENRRQTSFFCPRFLSP